MKKFVLFLAFGAISLSGCSSEGVPDVIKSIEANARIAGTWKNTQSYLLSGAVFQTKYLELNDDGTGLLYRQSGVSKVLNCTTFLYSVLSDTTVLFSSLPDDLPTGDTFFTYEVTEETGDLTFENKEGKSSTFEAAESVPSNKECKTFENVEFTEGIEPRKQTRSGLVFDGDFLWYKAYEEQNLYPIDPSDNTIGTPLGGYFFPDDLNIQASQGDDFWATCGCGHNGIITRRERINWNDEDSIHLAGDLDHDLTTRGAAFDGTHLFLIGNEFPTDTGQILKIDASGEPDVLSEVFPFEGEYQGLTWDGSAYFWTLSRQSGDIIKIDAQTMLAVATYQSIDSSLRWDALAWVEDSLFIAGYSIDGTETVLAKITP